MRIPKISKVSPFLVSIIMMAIILCCSNQVQAAPVGDFTYTVENGKAQVTGYTGTGGEVAIPSSFAGSPVTSIGDYAFFHRTDITIVNIPQGVTSIGKAAFENCYGLTTVIIPESVTMIGDSAFDGCPALTNINIPKGATSDIPTIYSSSGIKLDKVIKESGIKTKDGNPVTFKLYNAYTVLIYGVDKTVLGNLKLSVLDGDLYPTFDDSTGEIKIILEGSDEGENGTIRLTVNRLTGARVDGIPAYATSVSSQNILVTDLVN